MRIAILLIAGLVSMVLALSRGPDENSHEKILNALRSMDLTYAALQRDVLQARSGILKNYDFLDISMDRMRSELEKIARISASVSVEDRKRLEERLTSVARSIAEIEDMIERFKSGNAIIQNSLRIFVQTLSEMRLAAAGAESAAAFVEAQLIGQQMWLFQSGHDPGLGAQLRSSLMQLRALVLPGMADLKTSLVEHGLLIVRTLPTVDAVVAATQASETVPGNRELQREYLHQFGRTNARMSIIRLMLALISLSLSAYATALALRLKFFADSLSWRLHVEQSVNDAVTRLSLEPERFRAVMEEALTRMKQVFGFQTVSLLSLDPSDYSQRKTFGSQSPGQTSSLLTRDFLDDLQARPRSLRNLVMWRHPPRAPGPAGLLEALRKRRPLAVASFVRPHEDLAVLMVARCQPAYWNMRTDEKLMRMTTDLLALAVEKHQRLADLDELDRRMEETQRLEAVGTLAGGVAHEFNNILMAIMGYAEMAAGALEPGLETRRYIDNVLDAGRRAKLVVDQMLAFGRMRRNPLRPFDAAQAAIDMLPVIEVCLPPGIRLHVDLPDEPAVMMGSAIEIQQLLVNLCKNAGEAIAGEDTRDAPTQDQTDDRGEADDDAKIRGHVKLSLNAVEFVGEHALTHGTLAPGHYWRIAVTDTGPGMAPARLKRIFEPFFTTKGNRGTGLGLSVVHGTVQSLKGAMNVGSIPGRGTRFEVYFPRPDQRTSLIMVPEDMVSKVPNARAPGIGSRSRGVWGNGELVAVVDGCDDARLMWEEKIAALGYEPVGFDSVVQLVEWYGNAAGTASIFPCLNKNPMDSATGDIASVGTEAADPDRVPDVIVFALGADNDTQCSALLALLRRYPDLPLVILLDGSAHAPASPVAPHRILKKSVSAQDLQDALSAVLEEGRRPKG